VLPATAQMPFHLFIFLCTTGHVGVSWPSNIAAVACRAGAI